MPRVSGSLLESRIGKLNSVFEITWNFDWPGCKIRGSLAMPCVDRGIATSGDTVSETTE